MVIITKVNSGGRGGGVLILGGGGGGKGRLDTVLIIFLKYTRNREQFGRFGEVVPGYS